MQFRYKIFTVYDSLRQKQDAHLYKTFTHVKYYPMSIELWFVWLLHSLLAGKLMIETTQCVCVCVICTCARVCVSQPQLGKQRS